jgi:class 3 adenylate cyclase
MISVNNEGLIKRIAKLVRQNKELEEQLKILYKQNEKLATELEKIRALYDKINSGKLNENNDPERKEKSLKFNMATVLFSEIHTSSLLSEDIDSALLMDELDEILFEFDRIAARYKIEKIKTIGDTFMCAGGIPVRNITNPVDVVMAALEMRAFLGIMNSKKELTETDYGSSE